MRQTLRKTFARKALMLVALLVGAVNGAWAQDESVTFSEQGYSNSDAIEKYEGTDFTITFNKGTNSNSPKYYTTGAAIRIYGGGYMTVASDTKTIEKIELTFASGEGNNEITTDAGTYDSGTWTGSANSVTFTIGGSSGHRRIASVAVTFASSDPGDQSVATSISIDDSGITNTNLFEAPEAGRLTASVSAGEGQVLEDAVVTWESKNEEVATIDKEGFITLVAAGTATITASYAGVEGTYKASSKTYTLTVINFDPNGPGSEKKPYTVAEARAAIDDGTGLTGVYATGIVSAIPTAYSTQYSNITFNIVDQSGDEVFLQAFRCKGDEAANVKVGDIVVVCGNLTLYQNTTYEFTAGCELVSLTHPAVAVEEPTFNPEAGTYTETQNVTIACATDGAAIYYTTDGTEPTSQSTLYDGAIAIRSTTTIKAIAVKGNDESAVATATYHFCSAESPYTVTQALAFSEYPANSIYVSGIVSTAPTQSPTSNGELTYYISVDGNAENQLQVYKGKGLNGDAFTAQDDIQVGDEVTIFGNVKIYNGTKEFDTGNYLVAFNRTIQTYAVNWTDTEEMTLYVFDNANPNDALQSGAKLAEGTTVLISADIPQYYQVEAVSVKDASGNDVTVTAAQGTWTFEMPTSNVTITVTASDGRTITQMSYASEGSQWDGETRTVTITAADQFKQPALMIGNGGGFESEITFSSSNEAVATVATDGKVTINTEGTTGTAVITATFAGNATYLPCSASFTIVYKSEATGDQFVKVTSTADFTDGEYLIVYEDGALAFNGGRETLDATNNTISVTIDNDAIAKTDENAGAIFTIAAVDGGYTIQAANGQYIGQTSDANGMKAQDEAITNTISFTDEGDVLISAASAVLRYNANSGQERFRYFKSSTYTNQKAVYLYKFGGEPDTRESVTLAFENVPSTINLNETATYAATASVEGLTITYSSSNEKVVMVDENSGEIAALAVGKATITATFAGNDDYKPIKATYTIEVVDPRQEVTLSFTNVPASININETATYAATASVDGLTITYSSSNEEVVMVDEATGDIAALAAGKATITAKFAGDDTYKPATAAYTIEVVDPEVAAETIDLTAQGFENAEKLNVVYGKDFAVQGHKNTNSYSPKYYTSGTAVRCYGGNIINVASATKALASITFTFTQDPEKLVCQNSAYTTSDTGNERTWKANEPTNSVMFQVDGTSGQCRITKVSVTYADWTSYTRTVTEGSWGTIFLPCDATVTGAQLYTIAGVNAAKEYIILDEARSIEAGNAYIFQATDTELKATFTGDFTSDVNKGNLVGSPMGLVVPEGCYLLSAGKVVLSGADQNGDTDNAVFANRAYIDLTNAEVKSDDMEGAVKLFINDTATGINLVKAQEAGVAYDLTGRRVNAVKGGLYIVNGKKVIK